MFSRESPGLRPHGWPQLGKPVPPEHLPAIWEENGLAFSPGICGPIRIPEETARSWEHLGNDASPLCPDLDTTGHSGE